jgi:PiT family inorganic phosphate transporter
LNWELVERILWAWVMTIPATALLAYGLILLARTFGWAT